MPRPLLVTVLVLAVAASCLAVVEGVARHLHPEATAAAIRARIDGARNTWRRPDALYHHVGDGTFELRFPERSERTAPRIMIVGDSFAMGHGVERKQRFGSLLAARLGDETSVDVLATSSYAPVIYRNIVRTALSRAHYRAVAVFVDQTDPGDELIYRNDLVPGDPLGRFDVASMTERETVIARELDRMEAGLDGWRGLLRRSATLNALRPFTVAGAFPSDSRHAEYVRLSMSRGKLTHAFQRAPASPVTRQMEELLTLHLDQIVTMCRARGVPLVLAANPWEHQVSPEPRLHQGHPPPYPRENRLEALLAERYGSTGGVTVLGLTEAFRMHPRPSSLFIDRPAHEFHWNAAGHAVVAEALLDAVAAPGLPTPASR